MNTVGGIKRPKNEDLSNVVDREREILQMEQEPSCAGTSKKGKSIWIFGILIPIAACILPLALLLSR